MWFLELVWLVNAILGNYEVNFMTVNKYLFLNKKPWGEHEAGRILLVQSNQHEEGVVLPCLWKTTNIILIPELEKMSMLPGNYHPISFLSTILKLFKWLLLARIRPLVDDIKRYLDFNKTLIYFPTSEDCYPGADATNRHWSMLSCWTWAKPSKKGRTKICFTNWPKQQYLSLIHI